MTNDPVGETITNDTFFEEGLSSYMGAMMALREFRREIREAVGNVLDRRLTELVRSIGIQGQPTPEPYPKQLDGNWDDNSAWVAVLLRHPQLEGYFGVLWRRDGGGKLQAGTVVTFAPSKRELRDPVRRAVTASRVANTIPDDHPREITLWEPIVVNDVESFKRRLEKLIDDWISVWTSVGGIRGLERTSMTTP